MIFVQAKLVAFILALTRILGCIDTCTIGWSLVYSLYKLPRFDRHDQEYVWIEVSYTPKMSFI